MIMDPLLDDDRSNDDGSDARSIAGSDDGSIVVSDVVSIHIQFHSIQFNSIHIQSHSIHIQFHSIHIQFIFNSISMFIHYL